ncbi:MAG: hypothetical protein EP329_03480 [Deltaproteobacteria bacterium]|nr:MAG: hypothetical protein EP329_03480 [Deltaproteobacteria bacterium]
MLRHVLALAFAAFLLLPAACDTDGVCAKGETCDCSGAGTCTWSCDDGGCNYIADGAGTASLGCNGGGCSLTATGAGTVQFTCKGGNCTANTSAQGDLNLSCSGGGCDVTCGGQGECNITQCSACTCDETAITASCSVE